MKNHVPRMHKTLSLITVTLCLQACAGAPKNAEEFREMVRSGARLNLKTVESFEVARPFADVSATLRKRTDECLRVTMTAQGTARGNVGAFVERTTTHTYKPTVIATAQKTELHVQMKRAGGGTHELGAPPDGYYRVVLDAVPVGQNRTKIDMYINSADDNLIRNALRGWVQGTNLGCPDVTKR